MTWASILVAALGLLGAGGIGALMKTWLEYKRGKRKDTDNVALALVEKLEQRVVKLEGDLEDERTRCEAMLSAGRHSRNNQRQIIYSLLHLFDLPATKRRDALAAVRKQISDMEATEAHEAAIYRAAPLAGGSLRDVVADLDWLGKGRA